MRVNGKHYRTVWMQGSSVYLIEQNLLPFEFKIVALSDYQQTCAAIRDMLVRGAGAIGATAGFAMAQAFLAKGADAESVRVAKQAIQNTRPTAQNLFYAVERVYVAGQISSAAAVEQAQKIAEDDIAACKKIGQLGEQFIEDGNQIQTHCNAGWLAFVDFGSALSPIYSAKSQGKKISVLVDETRPRGQGARLTAWELGNEDIEYDIIADNAGAHFMSRGMVDLMIVGADRIAANGDVANKIGTLEKAIAAKYFDIPFYVAAPTATIDFACRAGVGIPIEERDAAELFFQSGPDKHGEVSAVRICAPSARAKNPAFDVTPANLITAIITEKGVFKPRQLAELQA